MRYLGIDYGSKKVGLALSDEAGQMGFPHSILANTPHLDADICALIAKENVGAVVIGESMDYARADNAIAEAARELGARVRERAGVPVYFEDETLTSAQARRAQEREPKSRRALLRGDVDASAAALILTSYLSRSQNG